MKKRPAKDGMCKVRWFFDTFRPKGEDNDQESLAQTQSKSLFRPWSSQPQSSTAGFGETAMWAEAAAETASPIASSTSRDVHR